jgi:hypothetical protein
MPERLPHQITNGRRDGRSLNCRDVIDFALQGSHGRDRWVTVPAVRWLKDVNCPTERANPTTQNPQVLPEIPVKPICEGFTKGEGFSKGMVDITISRGYDARHNTFVFIEF